jgi:hypothetical protein
MNILKNKMDEIKTHIDSWIDHLSTKQIALGNYSVCPFAKKAGYEIIVTDGSNINPPPWDFELIIYKLPDEYTVEEITELASEYNNLYPEMVFLPDHKDRDTFINGVPTNNSKYNFILCQWRDNLQSARDGLEKTDYYSFWDSKYLEEILNT